MAFATAFSAIGTKVTASAVGELGLKASASFDNDGNMIITATVTKGDDALSGATVQYSEKSDMTDASPFSTATNDEGVAVTNPITVDKAKKYFIKATADIENEPYASGVISIYYPGKFGVTLETSGEFKAVNVNKELQVGVVTLKKGVATIKNWDTYDAKTARYNVKDSTTGEDLASKEFVGYDMATPPLDVENQEEVEEASGFITLTPKKDMYVAFRTVGINGDSYTDPIFYEIQKNSAKYKAKIAINTDKDTASIKVNDAVISTTFDDAKVYYSVYSSQLGDKTVNEAGEIDSQLYNTGASIQVTPKGKKTVDKVNVSSFTYLGKPINLTTANAIQADAKTVTVKLKKRANAPAVSINYAKSSATIPKATKYRVIQSVDNWEDTYTTNSDKKSLPLTGTEGLIQIYKAATEKALASKVGVSTYAANKALEVATTTTDGLAVSYKDGDDLILTNNTKEVIEYFVGTSEPTSAAKWTKVKASAKSTIKAAKVDKAAKVYARRSANAKNFLIAGPYNKAGFNYAAAADAAKTEVTITSTAFSADKKTVTITLGQIVSGTVTTGTGQNKVERTFEGGKIVLDKSTEEWANDQTIEVTLSSDSSKLYRLSGNTIKITSVDPATSASVFVVANQNN